MTVCAIVGIVQGTWLARAVLPVTGCASLALRAVPSVALTTTQDTPKPIPDLVRLALTLTFVQILIPVGS